MYIQSLDDLRHHVDAVDAQLISLLAQRFDYTRQIGLYKRQHQIDPHDPVREYEKLEALQNMAMEDDLDPDLVKHIFVRIMQTVVRQHRDI